MTKDLGSLQHVPHILDEALKTFKQRQSVYKKSCDIQGEVMNALFPDGIKLSTPEEFKRYSLLNFQVSKMIRYASNFHEGGHQDSTHDLGVYAFMQESSDQHEHEERHKTEFRSEAESLLTTIPAQGASK